MRVQAAQHETAAVEECQQRKRPLPDGAVDAQPQVAAGTRDAAFGHRANSGRWRHEASASLILRTRIVNRQRVGCRHAGSHVEQGLDLWIDGHVRYPILRHHGSGCHGKMRDRSGERREPMERLPHLVPDRRIQCGGQCRLIVEHHLVALHMRDARPRQATAPVYTGVDLDLPNAGEARHDRRMVGDVVGQPGRQVLGRAFIGDEIGAGPIARQRTECGIRHRITPHQHRLLRGAVRPQRIEFPQVAIGRQRGFQSRDVIEVELQGKLRRRAVVEIRIAGARRREDEALSQSRRGSDHVGQPRHVRRGMLKRGEPADRHVRNSPATAAGA